MRATTLLTLTVATLLVPSLQACGPKRSALDIASSQPATAQPPTTPAAAPPTTPAPAPVASTTPAATPAPAPATPPASTPAATPPKPGTATAPAPTSTPAVATPAGSPQCLAGCNSPTLAPEVQQTCRIQCARLAQEAATSPMPAQPQPDFAAQRAQCEAGCDKEASGSDRATCRLQCGQIGRSSGGYSTGTTYPSTYPTGSPTTYPSGTPSSAQQQQQIALCQSQCDRETSPTDRATCRNNCGAVGTVLGPAGPSQWVLGPAPQMSEAEQRAAVIKSSGGVVQGSGGATTPARPPQPAAQPQANPQCAAQAQTCRNACAGSQTTCTNECNKGKMSETDRATCHLTCTSAGDACRDDCRIKEGACQPPTYR